MIDDETAEVSMAGLHYDRDRSASEVMTPSPLLVPVDTTVADAARIMRDADIGALLVEMGTDYSAS